MECGFLQRRSGLAPCLMTLLVQALEPSVALATELIKPTLEAKDLRVVVRYLSMGELVQLQGKYGANIDRRVLRQTYRHGFSILKTNRETGARTCEIYLADEQRPRERDDEGTLTLGHELLHCMLGDYHR